MLTPPMSPLASLGRRTLTGTPSDAPGGMTGAMPTADRCRGAHPMARRQSGFDIAATRSASSLWRRYSSRVSPPGMCCSAMTSLTTIASRAL